jgi:hypothetical protein
MSYDMPRQLTELTNRHLHGVTLSVRLFVELLKSIYGNYNRFCGTPRFIIKSNQQFSTGCTQSSSPNTMDYGQPFATSGSTPHQPVFTSILNGNRQIHDVRKHALRKLHSTYQYVPNSSR